MLDEEAASVEPDYGWINDSDVLFDSDEGNYWNID